MNDWRRSCEHQTPGPLIGLLSADAVVSADSRDATLVMKIEGDAIAAEPTAVAVGDWAGAAYDISLPGGGGEYVNTHIRAELIKAGTRSEALEFLKSIVVTVKD